MHALKLWLHRLRMRWCRKHPPDPEQPFKTLLTTIMATQAEIIETLDKVKTSQAKTAGEIADVQAKSTALAEKVAELQELLNHQTDVSPELAAAVQAVADGQQALDDAIPDVPVTPTE